jgi:hypothetical protein
MCSSFIVPTKDGDVECETVGNLRAVLDPVLPYPGEELDADKNCLCNVDQDATAERHGFKAVRDGFDWLFVPLTPRPGLHGAVPPAVGRNR